MKKVWKEAEEKVFNPNDVIWKKYEGKKLSSPPKSAAARKKHGWKVTKIPAITPPPIKIGKLKRGGGSVRMDGRI